MIRIEGGSLIVIAAILIVVGIILRWDLIKWLIDIAGIILIVVGIIVGIVGLVNLVLGRGRRSSGY